jgi:hypothetical protein
MPDEVTPSEPTQGSGSAEGSWPAEGSGPAESPGSAEGSGPASLGTEAGGDTGSGEPAAATVDPPSGPATADLGSGSTEHIATGETPAPSSSEPTAAADGADRDAPNGADQNPPSAASPPAARGLSYAVDIVFCIDVTGSMTPVIDAVKTNALRFYEDVQTNLTAKGKNVDQLRVRVIAFRDFTQDAETALQESSFFPLPDEQTAFDAFVGGLVADGGGDAPESGLEALALAINSPWTSRGDRRRQVVVVWTDAPAHPLNFAELPADLASSVPSNFSELTDLWEDPQGPVGASSKRLILFAPDGSGWSDISANWENVVHHPSQAGGGLSDVDYGTIVDSIGNSV